MFIRQTKLGLYHICRHKFGNCYDMEICTTDNLVKNDPRNTLTSILHICTNKGQSTWLTSMQVTPWSQRLDGVHSWHWLLIVIGLARRQQLWALAHGHITSPKPMSLIQNAYHRHISYCIVLTCLVDCMKYIDKVFVCPIINMRRKRWGGGACC